MTISFYSFARPSMVTMKVQDYDYEYYEAHAKDVKVEDITSDENNAGLLAMVRHNNPELTHITLTTSRYSRMNCFVVREGDDLGWLGYFVGSSEKLETLYIDDSLGNINLSAFLDGLVHNRSIKTLQTGIDLGESFKILIPFLRNNDSLRHLHFDDFQIELQCARNITLLLSHQNSLKGLNFVNEDFHHEGLTEIARALKTQPQLEELRICCNNIVREGYAALGNALEGCLNLRKLDLTVYDSDTEDDGLPALVKGLKHCHNLTSLDLFGDQMLTEEGSRSLSTLLQSDNCRLERLDLGEMNIDDDGMAVLATGLANLPSLKWLKLWNTSIGDEGLQDLVRGLDNCNLVELVLSSDMLMDSVQG